MNQNRALIEGLRLAADFLELHPDMPQLGPLTLRIFVWGDKVKFKEIARNLGSLEKKFSEHYFGLHKQINEALDIEVNIDREAVCKKVVIWECDDEEALLKLVEQPPAPEEADCDPTPEEYGDRLKTQ